MIVIDTSAWIPYLQEVGSSTAAILVKAVSSGKVLMLDLILLELLQGVRDDRAALRIERQLADFAVRPVLDADGALAIGKFPSVNDERAVTKGEILALMLATDAGINAAAGRIVDSAGTPVAVIRRFDRERGERLMYVSAATLMQVPSTYDAASSVTRDWAGRHSTNASGITISA